MTTKNTENAAITTLEHHAFLLSEGMDSISEQEKQVEKMRADLVRAEQRLEDSKVAYTEITGALERLRA